MAKKVNQSLDERLKNRFKNSGSSEVAKLKAEIEGLKSNNQFTVRYDEIKPSDQVRQTFTTAQIAKRKRSLLAFGQLSTLILIKDKDTGELLIEDGELTWRSAQEIIADNPDSSFVNIKAEMSSSNNSREAKSRSLLHHQTYEGLNSLDRAEGILLQLQEKTEFAPEEIIKALRNISYQLRSNVQLAKSLELYLEYDQKDNLLEENLNDFQLLCLETIQLYQVDFNSYVSRDLLFIDLEPDLKLAIRTRDLFPSHALIIRRLSSKKINKEEEYLVGLREKLITKTLAEQLTKKEVTKEVEFILSQYFTIKETKKSNVKQETKASLKIVKTELKNIAVETLTKKDLVSLESLLEKKLAKVKSQLTN